jgi:hypothetical protein
LLEDEDLEDLLNGIANLKVKRDNLGTMKYYDSVSESWNKKLYTLY